MGVGFTRVSPFAVQSTNRHCSGSKERSPFSNNSLPRSTRVTLPSRTTQDGCLATVWSCFFSSLLMVAHLKRVGRCRWEGEEEEEEEEGEVEEEVEVEVEEVVVEEEETSTSTSVRLENSPRFNMLRKNSSTV